VNKGYCGIAEEGTFCDRFPSRQSASLAREYTCELLLSSLVKAGAAKDRKNAMLGNASSCGLQILTLKEKSSRGLINNLSRRACRIVLNAVASHIASEQPCSAASTASLRFLMPSSVAASMPSGRMNSKVRSVVVKS
jgi:hypothetical protein